MEKSIKRLEAEISRLNREFAILQTISQTVNQSVDLDEILNHSLDKMMEMTEIRSAGIYLVDEKENDLVYVPPGSPPEVFKRDEGVKLGRRLQEGAPWENQSSSKITQSSRSPSLGD
jgi:nitrate/nitrite-specific signal transduction histidine kinase